MFYPGFDIQIHHDSMQFTYGDDVFGPSPELRSLDAIRASLADPACEGPDTVYSIVMDIGKKEDISDLNDRHLLYGAVTYAKGTLGREPIRSQGHIHAVSASCNSSTCEVYEIWEGEACIYMQESGSDNAGRCFAVYGQSGDVIIVPPGWVHATINADPECEMSFGAWCIRDFGFDYSDVRRHHGIAFFPFAENGKLIWERNTSYSSGTLIEKKARTYEDFGLRSGISIYRQYSDNHSAFEFVTNPKAFQNLWNGYEP